MGNYSMPRYFQNMPVVGKPVKVNAENVAELRAIEDDIHAHIVDALSAGKADEDMNAKGQLTDVYKRQGSPCCGWPLRQWRHSR